MGRPVFSIQWHITAQCEQRCRHCYLFNSPEAEEEIHGERLIGFNELKLIADNLISSCKQLGAKPRISLTGGNPILHPHFWQLLKYLQDIGVKTMILGNPFGVTDEVAGRMKNLGIDKFQMSIDGMEYLHDHMRKRGSFLATSKACEILKRNGIKVTVMSTVSRANMNDIPGVIKHVVNLGVESYGFARYCPTHGDAEDLFSPQEYRMFLNTVWETYSQFADGNTNFVLKDHLWYLFLMEKGLFQPKETDGVIVSGCGLGISHLSVLADGRVFACRRFNSPVGRVPGQSLFDIFTNKKMDEYRDYSRLDKCKDCVLLPYCRGCMAVAYGSSGAWTSADPQCWK